MTNPNCCGQQAKWVRFNDRLQYWFCEKCKNEVQEKKAPETSDDDNNIWYPGLAGYTPPSAGIYKRAVHVAFSGGLSAQPPPPTPLGLGEVAQFTGTTGTPCYANVHCWTSKFSYGMNSPCTCGQRIPALPPQPPPAPTPSPPPAAPYWASMADTEVASAAKNLAGMKAGSTVKFFYPGHAVKQSVLKDCFEDALLKQGMRWLLTLNIDYVAPLDAYEVTITKNY